MPFLRDITKDERDILSLNQIPFEPNELEDNSIEITSSVLPLALFTLNRSAYYRNPCSRRLRSDYGATVVVLDAAVVDGNIYVNCDARHNSVPIGTVGVDEANVRAAKRIYQEFLGERISPSSLYCLSRIVADDGKSSVLVYIRDEVCCGVESRNLGNWVCISSAIRTLDGLSEQITSVIISEVSDFANNLALNSVS